MVGLRMVSRPRSGVCVCLRTVCRLIGRGLQKVGLGRGERERGGLASGQGHVLSLVPEGVVGVRGQQGRISPGVLSPEDTRLLEFSSSRNRPRIQQARQALGQRPAEIVPAPTSAPSAFEGGPCSLRVDSTPWPDRPAGSSGGTDSPGPEMAAFPARCGSRCPCLWLGELR